MRFHIGSKPGFVWYSQSWYAQKPMRSGADGGVDSFQIGMYQDDGSTTGSFAITWYEIGGKLVPRLEAYNDSWSALEQFPRLLSRLVGFDEEDLTPEQLYAELQMLGVADLTDRVEPASGGRADPHAVEALDRLTDEGRLAVMACFCRGCGRSLADGERCSCMRDD